MTRRDEKTPKAPADARSSKPPAGGKAPVSSGFLDDDDETVVFNQSSFPSDFSSDDDDASTETASPPEFDDLDDEATQLLPSDVARGLAGRSVSGESRGARPLGPSGRQSKSSPSSLPPRIGGADEADDTVAMPVPAAILSGGPRPPRRQVPKAQPFLVDEATPVPNSSRVRSLASLPPPDLDMNDRTMSSPNIVRMSFQPQPTGSPTPDAAGRHETFADTNLPDSAPTMSEEAHTAGRLVVDAPADATVFVDGVEQGKGRVVVSDLDRFTHYVVRVHRPAHRAWSASVSLGGEVEAQVVPDLVLR